MRILLTSATFYPRKFGGITLFTYNIAKALLDRGHEVTVYTTDANDKYSRLTECFAAEHVDGITVKYFKNISNSLAYNNYYLPLGMVSEIKNNIKKFDVIHLNNYRSTLSIIVQHYSLKNHVPYILDVHGGIQPIGQKRFYKKVFDIVAGKRILEGASRHIAGCETEINEFRDMGIKEHKISYIPPFYDTDLFSCLPSSGMFKEKLNIEDKHLILFLGRLHKIKGISFLIESFNQLNLDRDDVILALAGPDQGCKSGLEALINKLDLSRKVIFTGTLCENDKLSALVDANMLVQTSIYERGPGSPFEAILCDTPIIVTRDTGAGEIVNKIDAGYLIEYGDIVGLKNLMNRILENPAEANLKTQLAKQYIINNLSWKEGVKQYEGIYKEVITSRNI